MRISQLLLITLYLTLSCTNKNTPERIVITKKNLINTSGYGNAMALFDEQDTGSVPVTIWESSSMTSHWPSTVIIDLGRKYKITNIYYFDAKKSILSDSIYLINKGRVTLDAGEPFDWYNSLTGDINNVEQWTRKDWNVETRYIRVQKISGVGYIGKDRFPARCDVALNELILEGYPLEAEPAPIKIDREKMVKLVSVDKFIGMNSYMWTPDKVHDAVGIVREYRPWKINGVPNEQKPISWKPINERKRGDEYARNVGSSDDYYLKMNQMGVEPVPCIHRHIDEENNMFNKPNFDNDPKEPGSYSLMADYCFQYVARYGHAKVADSLIRSTEESPKTGLGYINYIENWNEGDRYWGKDPRGYFTPYEFSAFCSASYDGHKGEMGSGYGIKNADPNCKLVMGGVGNFKCRLCKGDEALVR